MAQNDLDIPDWDSSMDYDLGDPFSDQQHQKRGVIYRATTSFAGGAADAFKSPRTLKMLAANMLPKGYGTAINFGDTVVDGVGELYNIAAKELQPSLPAMRRITQRYLPKARRFMPEAAAREFERFAATKEGNGPQESAEDAGAREAIAGVFGIQMETEAKARAEDRLIGQLQHAQSAKMGRQQVASLQAMQAGIGRLVDYQDNITNRYQRRMLELSTRSYFLQRDQARLSAEQAKRMDAQLNAIVSNTAEPDIVKQSFRHTASNNFRNRMAGAMQDTAGKFISGFMGRTNKRIKDNLKDFLQGLNGGVEMVDMMGDMGDDVPMLEAIASMLGQTAVTQGGRLLGGPARRFISKHAPGMEQTGGKLHRIFSNIPQLANKWARSPTKREGILGLLEEMAKEIPATYTLDTKVGATGIGAEDTPAAFDKLTRRSIVEVIPGFLSRIHHEVSKLNDPKAARLVYNIDRNKFTSIEQAGEDMTRRIFTVDKRASTRQSVEQFVDEMLEGVSKRQFPDKLRGELARQIMMDNANAMEFDLERYTSPASNTPELTAKTKLRLKAVMRGIGELSDGRRDQKWLAERSDHFNELGVGDVIPVSAAGVYRSAGYRELLEQQGLLKVDGMTDHLDMAKILELIQASNFDDIKVEKKSASQRLGEKIREGGQNLFDRATNRVKDLYARGGTRAVLTAAKLAAGEYIDKATGKVIETWDQVRGEVVDSTTGNVVLDVTQLTGGLIDTEGRKYEFDIRQVQENLRSTTESFVNETQRTARRTAAQVRRAAREIKDVCSKNGTVLLSSMKLRMGNYRDQITGVVISSVEEIVGPVVDENGNVVVTMADIIAGLRDREGAAYAGVTERTEQNARTLLNNHQQAEDRAFDSVSSDASSAEQGAAANADFVNTGELERLGTEQVELLKAIVQLLAAQGAGQAAEAGDQAAGGWFRRGILDTIAVKGIKSAWWGAKTGAKGMWNYTTGVYSGMFKGATAAARGAGWMGGRVLDSAKDILQGKKDVWVKGKDAPSLLGRKIKLGHYQDSKTNNKIKSWKDITGPVIDITTNEEVLSQAEFDEGIYAKGPNGLVRVTMGAIGGVAKAVVKGYGSLLGLPFKALGVASKMAGQTMKWLVNKQVDVYVRGEAEPRLRAVLMKAGRYYSVKTGKLIRTYEDIDGEVRELAQGSDKVGPNDETVLDVDDLKPPRGICNRWGMTLKSPFSRILGAVGGAAVGVVKGAGALISGTMKAYGKLIGGMFGLGGNILNAPMKFLGAMFNPETWLGNTKKQITLLEDIYKVLDERLPGAKKRKGGWEETLEERAEEAKEKEEKKEAEEKDKKSGMGAFMSWIKTKGKGLFGFGGDDEEDDEEDEDDGFGLDDAADVADIADAAGDANERRRNRRGRNGPRKTGGRLNRWRRNRAARRLRRARAAGRGGRLGRLRNLFRFGRGAGAARGAAGAANAGRAAGAARGAASAGRAATAGRAAVGGGGALLGGAGAATAGVGLAGGLAGGWAGYEGADWVAGKAGLEEGSTGRTAAGITGGVAGGVAGTALAIKGASVVGGALATIGAPVWVPVAAAAALVAGVGYLGYRAYKYGRKQPIRRFRLAQYGIGYDDIGNTKTICQLENMLFDHVVENNGTLDVTEKSPTTGKSLTIEELYKLFDVDDGWFTKKGDQRRSFEVWYATRFKPIFLHWVKNLRALEPQMHIDDIDDKMTQEKRVTIIKKGWEVDRNLYSINATPIEGLALITDFNTIQDAYMAALGDSEGKDDKANTKSRWTEFGKSALKVSMGIPGVIFGNMLDRRMDEKDLERKAAERMGKEVTASAGGLESMTGSVKITAGADAVLSTMIARGGKVSSLGALRMRVYGLTELVTDRVRAIAALEMFCAQRVSFAADGQAFYTIDAERTYTQVATLFGLAPTNPDERLRWAIWFNMRFLPAFLTYCQAVRKAKATADLVEPERTLKADQLAAVAQSMIGAKTESGISVWTISQSPWGANERLNTDTSAATPSLLVIQAAVKKQVITEPHLVGGTAAAKEEKGFLSTMMDATKNNFNSMSNWLMGKEGERNYLGRAVDDAKRIAGGLMDGAGRAFDQVRQGDYSGAARTALETGAIPGQVIGARVSGIFNGNGGKFNTIPEPPPGVGQMRTARERFLALKPMLDTVAQMTGVDPMLLYAVASVESNFQPGAGASTSSAKGLYQFVDGTWNGMMRQAGAEWGIPPGLRPHDARANALLGALYVKNNYGKVRAAIGDNITDTDMYMAHFLGEGDAPKFLRAMRENGNANAAQMFPRPAASNKSIFYHTKVVGRERVPDLSRPRTLSEVYALMEKKMSDARVAYGGRGGTAASPVPQARASFADVTATVTTSANQVANGNSTSAQPAPPTTTTTTSTPGGGIGMTAAAAPAPVSEAPLRGYGDATASGSTTTTALGAAPPSLDSVGSLNAAAAASSANEAERSAAAAREKQVRDAQVRMAQAQSDMQAQAADQQQSRVTKIMEEQLVTLKEVAASGRDTVSLLRSILNSGLGKQGDSSGTDTRPATTRPLERQVETNPPRAPVSVRFPTPNR